MIYQTHTDPAQSDFIAIWSSINVPVPEITVCPQSIKIAISGGNVSACGSTMATNVAVILVSIIIVVLIASFAL